MQGQLNVKIYKEVVHLTSAEGVVLDQNNTLFTATKPQNQ